jgi:predicted HTH domain antitoxin
VLFLDEIDALFDNLLISVLHQLRTGYADRPGKFPQSVALVGLRDVRDYRRPVRPEVQSFGTSSPFNIKVESLTLPNFTADEVAELYGQHTTDTGQPFTREAQALAFELTRGQPWLVNALARQAVEKLVPDRTVPIDADVIEAAKEALILRRDTHLDSLIERLREPRVRRVIEPIIAGGTLSPDVLDDDLRFARDLGLVVSGPQGLAIANPIYREVIPRALEQTLPLPGPSPVACLEIPQDILDSARLSLDQVRVDLAVHLYEQGRLSIGKAHELAGLSLWEFRQLLGVRRIPTRFDGEDLEQDLETLREYDSRY